MKTETDSRWTANTASRFFESFSARRRAQTQSAVPRRFQAASVDRLCLLWAVTCSRSFPVGHHHLLSTVPPETHRDMRVTVGDRTFAADVGQGFSRPRCYCPSAWTNA